MRIQISTCCSLTLICVSALFLVSGCARQGDRWTKERPPVYPVSGQVLLDGQPVAKATVTFQPVDPGGKPGFALTDKSGHFEAQTFEEGDGLTAGKLRVAIQKPKMVDSDGNIVEEIGPDVMGLTEKNFLPEKYADFSTSGIEVTVEPKKSNELEPFNLR